MAMATLVAMALGLGTAGSADDRPPDDMSSQFDPLWPEHLRCLMLGAAAADDRICEVIVAMDCTGTREPYALRSNLASDCRLRPLLIGEGP